MVSVIIPVYNVEKYLVECLDSIINQTYKDLEIIIIDDGSTDNSGIICDEYALKDNRVKVVHKENSGQSAARNLGIEIARGEYLTFIDSDDYVELDFVEQLIYIIQKSGADIGAINTTKQSGVLEKGIEFKIANLDTEKALRYILRDYKLTPAPWGKIYRRRLFDSLSFHNGKIYEDFGIIFKLVQLSGSVSFADTTKYYYRYNPISTTKAKFTNKQLDYFYFADEWFSFVKKEHPRLIRDVKNHSCRNAIAFIKKMSQSEVNDTDTLNFLISKIKPQIFEYLISQYSFLSKLYGLLICINLSWAMRLFSGNNRRKLNG